MKHKINILKLLRIILAGIVLGEFAVESGWFNSEVMLYMAFVTVASYTTASYELGYAMKFMRMITLILTSIFGTAGCDKISSSFSSNWHSKISKSSIFKNSLQAFIVLFLSCFCFWIFCL